MMLGLASGVIVFVFAVAALIALSVNLSALSHGIVNAVGPDGAGLAATLAVWLVGAALLGGSLLVLFYTFTALTLMVGQPFFERISVQVDAQLGAPPAVAGPGAWRSLVRGLGEAVRLLALTMAIAVALFVISLIPVVGSVASFSLGAVFGGWLLSLELTQSALSRRGLGLLRERRRALASQRAVSVGFGTTVFVLFLIPFGAVATMPAATVGATLLSRRLSGEEGPRTDMTSGAPEVDTAR